MRCDQDLDLTAAVVVSLSESHYAPYDGFFN